MFNLSYKNEKGSITLYVLVAMLLIISVLTIVYMQINQKNANQLKALTSIQREYQSNDKNMDDNYDEIINRIGRGVYISLITSDGAQYDVSQWTNKDLILRIYYPDDVADDEKYYYKDGEKIKYTENEIIDSNCTIKVEYGGQVEEVKITKMDKSSPIINSLTVLDTTISSLKINVEASDNLSGIKTYKYYLDNTLVETSELDTYTYTGLTSGTKYTLRVEVIDNLGNTSSDSTDTTTLTPVARIESVYYGTLQSAIDAVPNDNTETTVTLLTNISENVEINENKNIILDLDNYTITNSKGTPIITSSGKLAIKDGSITGTYTDKVSTICVNANSELNLSNSIIDRNSEDTYSWETIELYGDLNIDSGKINNANSNAICTYADYDTNIEISGTAEISSVSSLAISNHAEMTITGGKITSTNGNAINNYGTLKISGTAQISSASTNYVAIANQNGATMTITGGTITSTNSGVLNNYGTVNISGTAQISSASTNYIAITNQNGATMTITGGTINAPDTNAISNNGELEIGETAKLSSTNLPTISNGSEGTVTITGGTITSTNGNAINNYGTVTITGGTISSTNKVAIFNQSGETVTITGGTITSTNGNVINNYGTLKISGTAKITASNKSYPTLYNQSGATATISGGTISNTAGGYSIYNEGSVTKTGGTVSGPTYRNLNITNVTKM